MGNHISSLFDGFNVTCMAYGITGAGKTHTMLGKDGNMAIGSHEDTGVSVLAIQECFSRISTLLRTELADSTYKYTVKVSYLEVYNETVRDLLNQDQRTTSLSIVEDPVKGIVVPGLKEVKVKTVESAIKAILSGNTRRTMASTRSNEFSSRSHAMIIIFLEKRCIEGNQPTVHSKLSLVDLAGSERESSGVKKSKQRQEGSNINTSLLALASCIKLLTERSKNKDSSKFIPYRNSKLTRLLKDSLGGNSKTTMIACVSSSFLCYEETINTLKYAQQARKIKNTAR